MTLGKNFCTTLRNISGSQSGAILPPKTHSLVATTRKGRYWHLVYRGQRCCYTSYIAKVSLCNEQLPSLKCQLPQGWETLRNVIHSWKKKKKKKFIFLFTYLVNVGGVEDPFWVVPKRLQNNKKVILEDYSKGIWFI